MKKFFAPLIAFVVLMVALAGLTLFFPTINNQTQQAEARLGLVLSLTIGVFIGLYPAPDW